MMSESTLASLTAQVDVNFEQQKEQAECGCENFSSSPLSILSVRMIARVISV